MYKGTPFDQWKQNETNKYFSKTCNNERYYSTKRDVIQNVINLILTISIFGLSGAFGGFLVSSLAWAAGYNFESIFFSTFLFFTAVPLGYLVYLWGAGRAGEKVWGATR